MARSLIGPGARIRALVQDFSDSGFFVLRTPLLPFSEFTSWSAGIAPSDPSLSGGDAAEAECRVLRERLRAVFSRPEVRDALEVASPDLSRAVDPWIEGDIGKAAPRMESALSRYLARMAGRPTPFGLFAGWSVGRIGAGTRLRLPGRAAYRRHTRVDGAWLCAFLEDLERMPSIRSELIYQPNECLFQAAGQWRYPERRRHANGTRYFLVAADDDEALRTTVDRARAGATRKILSQALASEDVSSSEAEGYIDELIDSGILVSNLRPVLTGTDPLEAAVGELQGVPAAQEQVRYLTSIQAELRALDQASIGVATPARQRALRDRLTALHATEDSRSTIRMELHKPCAELSLDPELAKDVLQGVAILHLLFGRTAPESPLTRFRDAFRDRFGDREIALLRAVDDEVGIGFGAVSSPSIDPSPLLAPLLLSPRLDTQEVQWRPEHAFLLDELTDMHRRGRTEIMLELAKLESLGLQARPLPDAFVALIALAARDDESIERGEFECVLRGVGGPSGARLFGRFCSLDPRLDGEVRGHLRSEERLAPDAIHAELVHLPEARTAHVMARPVLREFELPLLARSGAPGPRQLRLDDLYVSVSGDRVVIRSASHGREVRVHLTTAHNYVGRGIALYRFLGALQDQGAQPNLGWRWGPLQSAAFLPRVRCGRIVLSAARWRMDETAVRRLADPQGGSLADRIRSWREEWRIPRHVGLIEADQVLPVDLENTMSVAAFLEVIRDSPSATIREMVPSPEELCVRGPEGAFTHEIAIPFVRTPRQPETIVRAPAGRVNLDVPPSGFAPGSEWLYAKLFVAESAADRLLVHLVAPLVAEVERQGWSDRWFYLRYQDSGYHLRLRFHGRPEILRERVLLALHAHARPMLEHGLLGKLQLDTYEPEWTRYGGPEGTRLAERLFHADSEAALALVGVTSGDQGAEDRWPVTLLSMDRLLIDLGLDLRARAALVTRLADGAGRELNFGKRIKVRMGDLFRTHQRHLTALLGGGEIPESLAPALPILSRRSERIAAIAHDHDGENARALLRDHAQDHVHLAVNRIVRSSARIQEAVLYELLRRVCESRLARGRSE